MLDHIGYPVGDMARSRAFYERALAPLGVSLQMEVTEAMTGGHGSHCGFGENGHPYFWIGSGGHVAPGVHVAFAARDRAAVDAFHAAALAAGGSDNGPPGLRAHYHANYYAAFVRDPDGHNIEAVCHAPA
jgi:catechol 2,3-dioxygenase-like lactoylglutathione lyase family enzyme